MFRIGFLLGFLSVLLSPLSVRPNSHHRSFHPTRSTSTPPMDIS